MPVDGPEVTLTVDGRLLSDGDMDLADVEDSPGDQRLAWTLRAGDGAMTVRMVAEADREAGVVRKWRRSPAGVDSSASGSTAGPGLAAAGFETPGEPVAYNEGPVGLGQSVFGPGFFAGVEHPVGGEPGRAGRAGVILGLPVAVGLGAGHPGCGRRGRRTGRALGLLDTLRPVPTVSLPWLTTGTAWAPRG